MTFTGGLHRTFELKLGLFPSVESVAVASDAPSARTFPSGAAIESIGSICGSTVSKHRTPSKQSSKPNVCKNWAACALSALVKFCKRQ